jgi:hypothetical protein
MLYDPVSGGIGYLGDDFVAGILPDGTQAYPDNVSAFGLPYMRYTSYTPGTSLICHVTTSLHVVNDTDHVLYVIPYDVVSSASALGISTSQLDCVFSLDSPSVPPARLSKVDMTLLNPDLKPSAQYAHHLACRHRPPVAAAASSAAPALATVPSAAVREYKEPATAREVRTFPPSLVPPTLGGPVKTDRICGSR